MPTQYLPVSASGFGTGRALAYSLQVMTGGGPGQFSDFAGGFGATATLRPLTELADPCLGSYADAAPVAATSAAFPDGTYKLRLHDQAGTPPNVVLAETDLACRGGSFDLAAGTAGGGTVTGYAVGLDPASQVAGILVEAAQAAAGAFPTGANVTLPQALQMILAVVAGREAADPAAANAPTFFAGGNPQKARIRLAYDSAGSRITTYVP